MAIVLIAVGTVSFVYGAAMGVLYPARGFFLVWIVVGAALLAAGWVPGKRSPYGPAGLPLP